MLAIGAKAPNPSITAYPDYQGPLDHFWRKGPLILFFYPRDQTRICTKQACTLQSSLTEFGGFDANVLGSSTGGMASHQQYAEKNGIQFPLVADQKGQLAKAFDAFRSLIRISKRVTYVIDESGTVIGRIHDELSVSAHLEMIRKTLAEYREKGGS